jgi:hypothetical protein
LSKNCLFVVGPLAFSVWLAHGPDQEVRLKCM